MKETIYFKSIFQHFDKKNTKDKGHTHLLQRILKEKISHFGWFRKKIVFDFRHCNLANGGIFILKF